MEACLNRSFYLRDANTVARELLGKRLVHVTEAGRTAGIIVETEAYIGSWDKGAHSYPMKRTPRTQIQFGAGGYAYVYGIYGMHCCFNVVTNREGSPEVALIRALEPVAGLDLMQLRRETEEKQNLCSGPGKLCQAMDITKLQYGMDLTGSELFLTEGRMVADREISVSPRIHIDYAEECADLPWRYLIADSPFVSKVPARYRHLEKPYR